MTSVKISVNLPDFVVNDLSETAQRSGRSKTEVLRQALEDAKFFRKAVADGGTILVKGKDNKMTQIELRK